MHISMEISAEDEDKLKRAIIAGSVLAGLYFFAGSHQPLARGKIHISGSVKRRPPALVQPPPLGLYLRMALGILEFLGGREVALHGAHSGRTENI